MRKKERKISKNVLRPSHLAHGTKTVQSTKQIEKTLECSVSSPQECSVSPQECSVEI